MKATLSFSDMQRISFLPLRSAVLDQSVAMCEAVAAEPPLPIT